MKIKLIKDPEISEYYKNSWSWVYPDICVNNILTYLGISIFIYENHTGEFGFEVCVGNYDEDPIDYSILIKSVDDHKKDNEPFKTFEEAKKEAYKEFYKLLKKNYKTKMKQKNFIEKEIKILSKLIQEGKCQ